jgi:tRNA(fMet)-specific endonuclease VapC
MTCYVMDTEHLSLYERVHPQVRERIIQVRANSSDILTTQDLI